VRALDNWSSSKNGKRKGPKVGFPRFTSGIETLTEYPNPAPLKATLAAWRRAGRQLSRRIPGSRGHRAAKAKLFRLDRRCVPLRREAAHQLTTELAASYGHIVIEDLDLAAMKCSMGRRGYRRAISDAAMSLIGPMLAYETARCGGELVVAKRWFPSSQIHHGCTAPDGAPCRMVGKGRIDKVAGVSAHRRRRRPRSKRCAQSP
jgi:putative transposase